MFLTNPGYGGWCILRDGSGSSDMETYRLGNEDYLDMVANGFSGNQSSYATAISSFKISQSGDNIKYLDYFWCSKSSDKFTCHNYQPNWSDLGETDKYPRFGRLDPVLVAHIDASDSDEADFYEQTLYLGSINLVATAITTIALSLLTF